MGSGTPAIYCCNILLHRLGAVGSGTPAAHCLVLDATCLTQGEHGHTRDTCPLLTLFVQPNDTPCSPPDPGYVPRQAVLVGPQLPPPVDASGYPGTTPRYTHTPYSPLQPLMETPVKPVYPAYYLAWYGIPPQPPMLLQPCSRIRGMWSWRTYGASWQAQAAALLRTTRPSPRLLRGPPHSPNGMIDSWPQSRKPVRPAGIHPCQIRTGSRAALGKWAKGALAAAKGDPPHPTMMGRNGSGEPEMGEGMTQVVAATTRHQTPERREHRSTVKGSADNPPPPPAASARMATPLTAGRMRWTVAPANPHTPSPSGHRMKALGAGGGPPSRTQCGICSTTPRGPGGSRSGSPGWPQTSRRPTKSWRTPGPSPS